MAAAGKQQIVAVRSAVDDRSTVAAHHGVAAAAAQKGCRTGAANEGDVGGTTEDYAAFASVASTETRPAVTETVSWPVSCRTSVPLPRSTALWPAPGRTV